jgi:hypothetical protein
MFIMRKTYSYILILSLFILGSCQEISIGDDDDKASVSQKELIIQSLKGQYEGCSSDVDYSFLYRKSEISIVGDSYILDTTITSDSTCATATTLKYKQAFTIDSVELDTVNSSKINLALKVVKLELATDSAGQQAANYCGITDWALSVFRDVTGLSCPGLLVQDSFHTAAQSAGDMLHIQVTLSGSSLSIPISFAESGDNVNEIKFTDLQVTTKL